MTRKPSAAQRAADFLLGKIYLDTSDGQEVAAALLRKDRERRSMERAIVDWEKTGGHLRLAIIARRLAQSRTRRKK